MSENITVFEPIIDGDDRRPLCYVELTTSPRVEAHVLDCQQLATYGSRRFFMQAHVPQGDETAYISAIYRRQFGRDPHEVFIAPCVDLK